MGDKRIQQITDELADEYKLTRTESNVLFLILQGQRDKEIAEVLGSSHKTVKQHVSAILAKTELAGRTEVQALALTMLAHKYNESEADLDNVHAKWTSIEKEMDKRKSRKSSHLQHQPEKYSTKKDTTKDLDTRQVEHLFGKRGGNGE